jgi:hypothetical protein
MDHTRQQNTKKVFKSLEKWAEKILCRDNDYVQNLANADEETKKCFQRTKKHMPNQYAMSNTSYKPNNQEASNNVNIVQFTPEQQWHKTPDQSYLHLCDFMMEGIETMTKTANVDIGLVEKPFQHTCLYHLQDCVVNGDYLAI